MTLDWLKRAFAVDPPGPAEPDPQERAALESILAEIARRRMTGPAILFLESMRGMNAIASQAMVFLQPFATVVLDQARYDALARYLERRGSIDWICDELARRGKD